MNQSKQTLLNLLQDTDSTFFTLQKNELGYLTPTQMAHLYFNAAFLVATIEFIKEQHWIKTKEDKVEGEKTKYIDFVTPLFTDVLSPLSFLKEFLVERGPKKLQTISKDSLSIETNVIAMMIQRSNSDQKEFAIQCLNEMSVQFLAEEGHQEGRLQSSGHKGPRLYRTFDRLDELFALNYQLDKDSIWEQKTEERLYQGSGVGVQSGYSTILLALHELNLKSGSSVIDLGSGFGRVGLVCSLLRPDIVFTGYEFVAHRVDVSNEASRAFGQENNLKFRVQDLSLESFKIPAADVYYLYDPFTKETYHYVLKQLVELSQKNTIAIVTKGNARTWLTDIANEHSWPDPILIDEGNLCIFKTA